MSFTVRHFDPHAGEITSRHDNRMTAALAFALELRGCTYAELRDDRNGRVLASYVPGEGSVWRQNSAERSA